MLSMSLCAHFLPTFQLVGLLFVHTIFLAPLELYVTMLALSLLPVL